MDSSTAPLTWSRPISPWLVPVLLLALGVFVILFDGLGLESGLSNHLFDAYQRHAARSLPSGGSVPANPPVKVLELPSFDEDRLVDVTRMLSGQGVQLIVFTAPVAFGPSPQSLSAHLPPGNDAARAALAALPEPGHDLGEAIAATKAVLPVVLGQPGREPHVKAHFVYRGTRDPFGHTPRFAAASAPAGVLESSAAGLAAANLEPDNDGVVRRVPIAFRLGDGLIPGMAAEAARLIAGKAGITVVSDERDPLSFLSGIGIASLEVPQGQAPTAEDGRAWLRYARDADARLIDPNALGVLPLKDAVVVVGLEGRQVQTPLGPASTAGVIAESIENLLANSVLVRPSWARVAEALFLAAIGAAMIFLLGFGLGWSAVLVLLSVALAGLVSWYLYIARGVLIDWATPAAFLGVSFVAAVLLWLYDLQLTYAKLRAAFSNSLPRASLEKIARNPGLLKPQGERRPVTYLVCGVHMAPVAAPLEQNVLNRLIDQALAYGGTLDRVGADGFAVFWNAPLEDEDHARHACDAANGMAAVAAEIAQHEKQIGLEISVGIASGEVIAGGGNDFIHGRTGYGIQGEAPLLAERIRSLTHRYGAPLLATDGTRKLAERGAAFLEVDTIASAGGNTTLYALMGNSGVLVSPKFRALTVFHDHLFQAIRRQNWRLARELIAQCRRLSGANQALYELHLARIAYYERNPPGAEWDGAFRPILE
ncbi:MAG TPA: CHASE2 domain-containing protein [Rhizomicrobium sp.]|nr:CHASE2 domain-containing protein [Rhizomicrobium sp.]